MDMGLALLPGVDWSVSVVDLGSGEVLASHAPDRLLSTASVGKVFVLVELAERLRSGELAPDQPLDRRAVAPVADSGLWQHLMTDVLPLVDVARLVGAVSDNLATNVLIDLLGLDAVRARAGEWAPRGSDLVDVVRGLRGPDDPPHLSLGCAADLVDVLARLWTERSTSGSVGETVLGWLAPGMDLSMVASAWHQDPLSHAEEPAGPVIVNKTGTNLGVRADVGVVDSGGRATAYAVLANWTEDPPGNGRDEVMRALRGIGDAVRAAVG
ncbi:class A beta-lactamase-related serine hydrolase [Knoellia locipacati]|uniref:serine hydrolase n=1 Tax=Knoellia locipacati TaxID=882824 RepID=UPI00384B1E4A